MFDWWSAPFAAHHSIGELIKWYQQHEITVLDTLPKIKDEKDIEQYNRCCKAISILGKYST